MTPSSAVDRAALAARETLTERSPATAEPIARFSAEPDNQSAAEPVVEPSAAQSPNLNALWAKVLMEALARAGVQHLSLAPGSRSAPLAIAARAIFGPRATVHVDERSAAFFALGAAKATGRPAAVLCTSGSAAGHFLPALIEASEARIPLVALTADRPPEVRGFGAPQAIDQVHLYGHVTRAFWDLPLPEAGLLCRLEAVVADACARAIGSPGGPVHLNIPLRDPLSPVPVDTAGVARLQAEHAESQVARRTGGDGALLIRDSWAAQSFADEIGLQQAAGWLSEARRPILIAGPEAAWGVAGNAVLDLARTWGIPIFADAASGLRFAPDRGAVVCAHHVAYLRAPGFAELPPDRIVTLGMTPTSGTVIRYLARHRPPALRIQADSIRRDPEGAATIVLAGDVADTCRRLAARADRTGVDRRWLEAHANVDRASARALADHQTPPFEIAAMSRAFDALPEEGLLFLASSMAIRYADSCLPATPRRIRPLANRGANGIDGLISTSLGAAVAAGRPLLLVVGDTAFLHDIGGLFASRHVDVPVVVLVLNNDGGGIFAYLPIAGFPEVCDPLCVAPHGLSFEHAARQFGLDYQACGSPAEVSAAALRGFLEVGVHVIEVRTDRHETEARYRHLLAAMADAAAHLND